MVRWFFFPLFFLQSCLALAGFGQRLFDIIILLSYCYCYYVFVLKTRNTFRWCYLISKWVEHDTELVIFFVCVRIIKFFFQFILCKTWRTAFNWITSNNRSRNWLENTLLAWGQIVLHWNCTYRIEKFSICSW